MSTPEAPKPAGIAKMWDVDDIVETSAPTPTPQQRETMTRSAEKLGFASREMPLPVRKPAAPRPPAIYTAQISARVRDVDKQRFEDLAYRLRVPVGEAFKILLDLEEEHRARAQ